MNRCGPDEQVVKKKGQEMVESGCFRTRGQASRRGQAGRHRSRFPAWAPNSTRVTLLGQSGALLIRHRKQLKGFTQHNSHTSIASALDSTKITQDSGSAVCSSLPERQGCDMEAGGVTCDIVPTTTTWVTFTPMPVACVSTVCISSQHRAWESTFHVGMVVCGTLRRQGA